MPRSVTIPMSADVPPTSNVISRLRPASVPGPEPAEHARPPARRAAASPGCSAAASAAGDAAVRHHHVQVSGHALARERAREPLEVAAGRRADEGVHARGREALELAELREDVGARGDERARNLLARRSRPRGARARGFRYEKRKQTATDSTPASFSARAAARTSSSSSGSSTSPVGGAIRSLTTWRWRRFTNGRACHGMSCMIE